MIEALVVVINEFQKAGTLRLTFHGMIISLAPNVNSFEYLESAVLSEYPKQITMSVHLQRHLYGLSDLPATLAYCGSTNETQAFRLSFVLLPFQGAPN